MKGRRVSTSSGEDAPDDLYDYRWSTPQHLRRRHGGPYRHGRYGRGQTIGGRPVPSHLIGVTLVPSNRGRAFVSDFLRR